MRANLLNRTIVAVGISAVALFGLSVPINGQPQRDQGRQEDQKDTKQQEAKNGKQQEEGKQEKGQNPQDQNQANQEHQAQQQQEKNQANQQHQAQQQRDQNRANQQGQAQARQPQGQPQPQVQVEQRLPQQQQQQLITQQQQRLAQYGTQLDRQQQLAQQRSIQLQQQRRTAQYGFQQQYIARLRAQLLSIQSSRNYNYGGDPYFYTPPSYRYSRGGRYYETNQYGVDLLRQAVDYGYEEGFEAGQADRQDHWAFSYQDSYAYQDGNYGYGGFYVDRDDYNYYFREGFRRGYDDGYYGRYQYGSYSNGRPTILGGALSVIITFDSIR
jgi:hypothetical protein